MTRSEIKPQSNVKKHWKHEYKIEFIETLTHDFLNKKQLKLNKFTQM